MNARMTTGTVGLWWCKLPWSRTLGMNDAMIHTIVSNGITEAEIRDVVGHATRLRADKYSPYNRGIVTEAPFGDSTNAQKLSDDVWYLLGRVMIQSNGRELQAAFDAIMSEPPCTVSMVTSRYGMPPTDILEHMRIHGEVPPRLSARDQIAMVLALYHLDKNPYYIPVPTFGGGDETADIGMRFIPFDSSNMRKKGFGETAYCGSTFTIDEDREFCLKRCSAECVYCYNKRNTRFNLQTAGVTTEKLPREHWRLFLVLGLFIVIMLALFVQQCNIPTM
jgi:hypothetical protein